MSDRWSKESIREYANEIERTEKWFRWLEARLEAERKMAMKLIEEFRKKDAI